MNLPDFYILGPEKTGTCSLYNSFAQHPEVSKCKIKEPQFFNDNQNFQKGLKSYQEKFVWNGKKTFDATPNYFSCPVSRYRMKSVGLPLGTKFVVTFRDPVDRAISQYSHFRCFNHIIVNRPEDVECARFKALFNGWVGEPRDFSEIVANAPREPLVISGEYILHLKDWHRMFGEENFLHLDYHELRYDYVKTCQAIAAHVGVDSSFNFNSFNINSSSQWAERSGLTVSIAEEQRRLLRSHFRPYNEALFEYLGKDFGWNG